MDIENKKGEDRKKKAFSVPSQLCFLLVVTQQEMLKAVHNDLAFSRSFIFSMFYIQYTNTTAILTPSIVFKLTVNDAYRDGDLGNVIHHGMIEGRGGCSFLIRNKKNKAWIFIDKTPHRDSTNKALLSKSEPRAVGLFNQKNTRTSPLHRVISQRAAHC